MKICLVLEGSYPYVGGGVSSWMHNYIRGMPEHQFLLWVIGDKRERKGRFVYALPKNVTEVREVFLEDALGEVAQGRWKVRFSPEERTALSALMHCDHPDWDVIFDLFQKRRLSPMGYLQSQDFLDLLTDLCLQDYPQIPYADTFHTIRSMLLPLIYLLGQEAPEADAYHAICTGYGGMLAAMGSFVHRKPLLLTEHGIYTREREEEIIRASWIPPIFKKQWTAFFYMLSDLVYHRAFRITSLFDHARQTQIELGCDPDACRVIANGIQFDALSAVPLKEEDGFVDIGAVIRLAPIKDVKTLLYAFFELSSRVSQVRLHILGDVDDMQYAQECYDLTNMLSLTNVIYTGRVDILKYFQKLDFTILTSISEGQPLSVLESFAARRPAVVTDVGCCRDLIFGAKGDPFGAAGYCVAPMYREGLADAMKKMCESRERRIEMGEIGQKRAKKYYRQEMMLENYRQLYREVEDAYGGNRI